MFRNGRRRWAEHSVSFGGITLWELIALAALIGGAHALSRYNYLLFHSSVEFFSVCIAFSIFIVGASAHVAGSNNFVVIASATYLFVALLDSLHALSYKGMPFLNDYEYYAPQFWIAARFLEAAGLFAGIWAIDARRRFNALAIFGLLFAITAALILSILHFRIFPICFAPGTGLTAFKVYSEYAIVGIYVASLWVLHQKRSALTKHIYELLRLSIVLMALMELCFTFYKSDAMSDLFNEIGHLIKIAAFYLLCKVFVIGSLRDPLMLVSRELRDSEEQLRANAKHLADILDLQRDIASSNLKYSALLQLILDRMTHLVACDGACLEIREDEEMVYEAATGLAAGFVGLRVKIGASLSGLSMTSNTILRAHDTESDPRVDREGCRRVGLRSMIVMPLRYDERSFGALKLMSARAGAFTSGAEQTLRLLQEFLGVTIARHRAQAALEESEEQFRTLADAIPQLAWMANADGWLTWYNDRWYQYTGTTPEQMEGWGWQSVHDPRTLPAVLERWKHSIATGEPFDMILPLRGADGVFRRFLTRGQPLKNAEGRVVRWLGTNTDVDELKRVEEALRESEQQYRSLFEHMLDGFAYCQMVLDERGRPDDFVYLAVNEAFGRITGLKDVIGKRVTQLIPRIKELNPEVFEVYGRVASTGHAERFEIDFKPLGLSLSVAVYSPAKGFFVAVFHDITERKKREAQVQLLLREVNHRAKNLLGVVQAIASQTTASGGEDFVARFSVRIQALAANQDLLVKSQWRGVDLRDLMRAQLAHFEGLIGSRIEITGPPLQITAEAAQPIAMALHELATNAGKYGALSTGEGKVTIAWDLGGDGAFHLSWTESAGPAVVPPTRRGFGTTVIAHVPQMQLEAEVTLEYPPGGLTWRLACSAKNVLELSGSGADNRVTA